MRVEKYDSAHCKQAPRHPVLGDDHLTWALPLPTYPDPAGVEVDTS